MLELNVRNSIQIAGVLDETEAQMLAECGVRFIGFPLRLDVHQQDLDENEALQIIKKLPAATTAVLITYLRHADEIVRLSRKLGVSIVQLHGKLPVKEAEKVKSAAPEISIIKSLVVKEDNYSELKQTIKDFSACADAFITDTFDPVSGASGATGKTHNWEVSRKLVEVSPHPVILAGGLNPANVRKAILEVRPAAVDSHTGVEAPDGRKDRSLVEAFVSEAKDAFNIIR